MNYCANIPELIDGRYRCIKQIGRGGTSSVYLCVDNHIGKKWAVKLILPDKAGNKFFMSEIATLKSLDYYMFPRITDAFMSEGVIGIVTDYIEGSSLKDFIEREGRLPLKRALLYFEELLKALIYLHTRSPAILYLDMKPANIMITGDGQLRLIDFGIAGTILAGGLGAQSGGGCRGSTMTGMTGLTGITQGSATQSIASVQGMGSPGYAAPEQYVPGGVLTEKTDVFALGMTLYAMLSGQEPYRSYEKQRELMESDLSIPKFVRELILKCTSHEPDERLSPAELLNILGIRKRKRRAVVPVILTGVAVCAMFVGAVYYGIDSYKARHLERYGQEMIMELSSCIEDGQYTRQGIMIICGYLDGNFLDDDMRSKYAYEVGKYYFDVEGEYSDASHYFEMVDAGAYPEVVSYLEMCKYMTHVGVKDDSG